jgi:beta-lactam-binding protein with PASTA domain
MMRDERRRTRLVRWVGLGLGLGLAVALALVVFANLDRQVPNVCSMTDRNEAETTLRDAGFDVEWVTYDSIGKPCKFLTVADTPHVVAQDPQGTAPRGTVVRVAWVDEGLIA